MILSETTSLRLSRCGRVLQMRFIKPIVKSTALLLICLPSSLAFSVSISLERQPSPSDGDRMSFSHRERSFRRDGGSKGGPGGRVFFFSFSFVMVPSIIVHERVSGPSESRPFIQN